MISSPWSVAIGIFDWLAGFQGMMWGYESKVISDVNKIGAPEKIKIPSKEQNGAKE